MDRAERTGIDAEKAKAEADLKAEGQAAAADMQRMADSEGLDDSSNSDGSDSGPKRFEPVTGKKLAFIFTGLLLAMFVSSLSETIAATALPTIVGDLGGVEMMQWISTAYILTSTIVMPIYGKVSDMFGRKRLLMGALCLYAAGKAVCGIAVNMDMLICGRLISGLGGGGLNVLSLAALSDVVPPRKLGTYMGVMGAVFTVSTVIGPLLGGWFVEVPGWRWIFWFTIPIAAIAVAALGFFLPKDAPDGVKRAQLDYFGMAALALMVTTVVLAAAWGGTTFAWDSVEIIGLLVAAAVSLGAFILIEHRAKQPIVPLALFKNRNFVICSVTGLVVNLCFMGTLTYLPTYFQIVDKMSPEMSGLVTIPLSIASFITSTLSGWLAARTGRYKWMLMLSSIVAAAGYVLMSMMKVDQPAILPMAYLFVLGFGIGFGMQLKTLVVQNEFSHAIVGAATSAYSFFGQMGSVLGTAFIGTLFTSRLTADLAATLPRTDNLSVGSITPQLVDKLPDAVQQVVAQGYSDALIPIFFWFAPLCAATAVLMLFIKFHPLAKTVDHGGSGR